MKTCKKCNLEKDYTEFYKERKSKDGYRSNCKSCMLLYQSSVNREYRRNICKKSYNKNSDSKKSYYQLNREKIKKDRLSRYYQNKDSEREYSRDYYVKNRSKINRYRSDYEKHRLESDNIYKCIRVVRSLIFISIYNNGYTKNSKSSEILGCSYEEFKEHIESKFEDWMSWDNHGKYTGNYSETWHLDHIIPISSAKNESDVIRLNHYTNFQPLCSKINLEKSNKINYDTHTMGNYSSTTI